MNKEASNEINDKKDYKILYKNKCVFFFLNHKIIDAKNLKKGLWL